MACRHCALPFMTASSIKFHCTRECRLLSIAEPFADIEKECWVWPLYCNPQTRYGQLVQYIDGKHHLFTAHRISWQAFYGTIPDGLSVLHECDNRPCFNPLHLFLGTHTDNAQDMVFKLRHRVRNEKLQKYSDELVEKLRADPRKDAEVSRAYGIPQGALWALRYSPNTRPWLKVPARCPPRSV
jgi:hypothetical protein